MATDRERVFTVIFQNCGHYRHVLAHIGLMPEQDANGYRDLRYTSTMYGFDDTFSRIKITSQTDSDSLKSSLEDGRNPIYAENVVWDEEFDLGAAERAIKALRKISKYLENAREIAGVHSSIGQYITRVIKACGAKKVIMKWDNEYQVFNVDYAGQLIDQKVQQWRNEVCGITTVG